MSTNTAEHLHKKAARKIKIINCHGVQRFLLYTSADACRDTFRQVDRRKLLKQKPHH